MVEYATILLISIRNWLHGFNLDTQSLLPGILIGGAFVLIVIALIKPPKV
jgi:hypothetical protein